MPGNQCGRGDVVRMLEWLRVNRPDGFWQVQCAVHRLIREQRLRLKIN